MNADLLAILPFSLLLALNLWLFFIRPKRGFTENVTTVSKIVAVYTFAIGVITSVGILKAFPSLASDLTSPNLRAFLYGNLVVAAIIQQGLIVALNLQSFGSWFVLLLYFPIIYLGLLMYLIFVTPWAYLAYVVVSIPIDSVLKSSTDSCTSIAEREYCIRAAVDADPNAFKSFLISLTAGAIAFGLKFFNNFRDKLSERFAPLATGSKSIRTLSRYCLWLMQVMMVVVLIVTIDAGWLLVDERDEPSEIYGIVVAFLLAVCFELMVMKRIRDRIKAIPLILAPKS
jgi:hypothetical protein